MSTSVNASQVPLPSLMTKRQVAEYLQVAERTIDRWVEMNGFPCIRITSATLRYRRDDVDRWVAENAETVAGE